MFGIWIMEYSQNTRARLNVSNARIILHLSFDVTGLRSPISFQGRQITIIYSTLCSCYTQICDFFTADIFNYNKKNTERTRGVFHSLTNSVLCIFFTSKTWCTYFSVSLCCFLSLFAPVKTIYLRIKLNMRKYN